MSRRSKKQRPARTTIPTPAVPPRIAEGSGPVAASAQITNRDEPWTRTGSGWMIGLLLPLAVLLAYQPAWHAGFIWDDDIYVTGNPLLTAPDGLWRIWFSFDSPSQYFPLVYSTLRLEHALWGLAPLGYHLVNIALHGANAVLLWRLLLRLEIPGAWLGAAIFALHPAQVESVAWVTELKNVQMGFFFLLSLLAWMEFDGGENGRPWRFYTLSLVLYALALFSKTTACTLPAALVLIWWWRGERIGWRRVLEVAPYLAMGIGMGLLTIFWERYHQGTQGMLFTIGPVERVLIAGRGVWFYLDKLIWPAKLTFSYPRWSLPGADPLSWVWLVALCGLGGAAYIGKQQIGRGPFAALAFFVATLSPVLGLIMLYTFRYSFVADHYQYLACIGPIALVCTGLERVWERQRLAASALCAVLLCGLGLLTWRQSGTYRNLDTLWRTTLARNPGSSMAHLNLGKVLMAEGRLEASIAEEREALRIDPAYADARYNVGIALLGEGRSQEAIAEFNEALRLNPADTEALNELGNALAAQGRSEEAIAEFNEALRADPNNTDAHYNLGNVLLQQGQSDQAIAEYRAALQINPTYVKAHGNLGEALLGEGQRDEAIAEFKEALSIDPNYADARYNLGNALLQQGQNDQAISEYRAVLRIDPGYAQARGNLGAALLQEGHAQEAEAEYREALRLSPAYADAHYNLGNALMGQGQTAEAIEEVQRAHELEPGNLMFQNALAWMLATASEISLRDGAKAEQLATHASQVSGGNNAILLRTLAAAYAQAGQFPNAVQTAQQALRLAQTQSNTALVNALPREIKLYEAGHSFEEAR